MANAHRSRTHRRHDADGLTLAGRRFLVTGGARGIGAAIVTLLARHGARGNILDLQVERAGQNLWPRETVDVADETAVRMVVSGLIEENGPFDGLIAAAGVVPTWHSPTDIDLRLLEATMAVNLRGFVIAVKHVAPSMRTGSTIVAIGSLNSWRGDRNLLAYAASKHALVGAVRSTALSLGPHGVRVNAVAPGPVSTPALIDRIDGRVQLTGLSRDSALQSLADLTALGTLATAADIADAALFLSSPLSSAITGQVLHVDGGLL